jgi:hypothetical protein
LVLAKKNPTTVDIGSLLGMIGLVIVGLLFVHVPAKTITDACDASSRLELARIGLGIMFLVPIPLVSRVHHGRLPLALIGFALYGIRSILRNIGTVSDFNCSPCLARRYVNSNNNATHMGGCAHAGRHYPTVEIDPRVGWFV